MLLAQAADLVGLLETILKGGVPLLLMVALYLVVSAYNKERNDRTVEQQNHIKEISELRKDYAKKVEDLLRERLDSESENIRALTRATEVMDSVTQTLERTNDTLEDLMEDKK
jgi:hypothetical protein